MKSFVHSYQDWLVFICIMALTVLMRLPSLDQPFSNDEGANAYHARLISQGEPLYGSHHPAHQLPGIYYTYALAFLLFGDSPWTIKALLMVWVAVTAYLLYRLGLMLLGAGLGLIAALFYLLLSSHEQLSGLTVQNELFANLPRVAAIVSLVYLIKKPGPAWRFSLVGLLAAASFLFRANYLEALATAGVVLLLELWQHRQVAKYWQTTIMRGLWMGLGFVAGLIPVVLYFWAVGVLPRFLMVASIGARYVNMRATAWNNLPPVYQPYWPGFPVYGLWQSNHIFVIYGAIGIVLIVAIHSLRTLPAVTIIIWLLFSYLQTTVTRVLFFHYYLLIVPPLVVLAAYPPIATYRVIQHKVPSFGQPLATLVLLLSLCWPLWSSYDENKAYYNQYVQYKLGNQSYRDFVRNGTPSQAQNLLTVERLAEYVAEHTATDDLVFYWSSNVQFYYLAKRRSPVDTIWPISVGITGPREQIYNPRTKMVILGNSNSLGGAPEWITDWLNREFSLEEEIGGQQIYRRNN